MKLRNFVGSAAAVALVLAAVDSQGHSLVKAATTAAGGVAASVAAVPSSSATCIGADGGGPGTLYDFAQLEQLWVSAGGPVSAKGDAAAVALAESSGCSTDLNTTDNDGKQTSYCLWQISDGTHSAPAAGILNPSVCAEQAVAKFKGEGDSFAPAWGTYDSGACAQFLRGCGE